MFFIKDEQPSIVLLNNFIIKIKWNLEQEFNTIKKFIIGCLVINMMNSCHYKFFQSYSWYEYCFGKTKC